MDLITKPLEVEHVLRDVFLDREESVDPQESARPQHTIEVEEDEVEELVIDPSVKEQGRVHDVESVIEERQALVNWNVERDQATVRDSLAERGSQIECRGDNSDIMLLHARSKRAGAHAVIQTDSKLPRFDG